MVQGEENDQVFLTPPQQMLRSLARELKQPLTLIARQAEFAQASNNKKYFADIERSAQEALTLIDGYLLCAQGEYGQKQLSLGPVGVGAVLYDVAREIAGVAHQKNYEIEIEVANSKPVMAEPRALRLALSCLAFLAMDSSEDNKKKNLQLLSYRRKSGDQALAILDPELSFTTADLAKARTLQGYSHLAFSGKSGSSGVHIAIADSLANSIGAKLCVAKHKGVQGLGLTLVKSEQLALV